MKILNQIIPPELMGLYKELFSNTTTGDDAGKITRTRRATKLPKKKKRNPNDAWQKVAEMVYKQIKGIEGIDTGPGFVSEERERLLNDIYNPSYWIKATTKTTAYISSTPDNANDPAPPPYGFRDPEKLPAITTYPEGTGGTAPAKSTGQIVGNQWQDGAWTWKRTVFELIKNGLKPADLPLVWKSKGKINVNANIRGSRPMLSLVMKAWVSDATNPITETKQPPVKPHTSIYWLYEIPEAESSPYTATADLGPQKVLNGRAEFIGGGTPEKVTVLTAPRAMFGLGWNNNDTVETTYNGTDEVMQLLPCINKPSDTPVYMTTSWYEQITPFIDFRQETTIAYKKIPLHEAATMARKKLKLNTPMVVLFRKDTDTYWIIQPANEEVPEWLYVAQKSGYKEEAERNGNSFAVSVGQHWIGNFFQSGWLNQQRAYTLFTSNGC